jgi:hypothetical protein
LYALDGGGRHVRIRVVGCGGSLRGDRLDIGEGLLRRNRTHVDLLFRRQGVAVMGAQPGVGGDADHCGYREQPERRLEEGDSALSGISRCGHGGPPWPDGLS